MRRTYSGKANVLRELKALLASLPDNNEEVIEWYRKSPVRRFIESQEMWNDFLALGGSLDPEPDSQSPFYPFEAQGKIPADGRSGVRRIRRGRVQPGH